MSYVNHARRKEVDDARLRVAIVLTSAGEPMKGTESLRTLMGACKRLFFPWLPGEDPVVYFNRVCESAARAKGEYCGEKVQPHVVDRMKLKAWSWPASSNPRTAMMDDLPHLISMHGVGNGREDTTQFVRGK